MNMSSVFLDQAGDIGTRTLSRKASGEGRLQNIFLLYLRLTIMHPERLIGKYCGKEKGPLLICLGGVHGNEPAGVLALEYMFKMLEVEPITNPNFDFKGGLLGIRGNIPALASGKRFVNRDLNRLWTKENIEAVRSKPVEELKFEEKELKEIDAIISQEIKNYNPEKVVVLDLHTTSSFGGIFTLVTEDQDSLDIGLELHAPVIKGMLKGIYGTTMHYFNAENLGVETTAVCFESGQHDEELSINRAIAAITNCMRTIGCVRAEDVENQHDKLLIEHSSGLPKVSQLLYAHAIDDGDRFRMEPNYKNFQIVKKGELLAKDKDGTIFSNRDGLLLMPLYQNQGEDGFFIISQLEAI